MQPGRTSLDGALTIPDIPDIPVAEKWDGESAHRRARTPPSEHGLDSIMGTDGMFYAKTVGGCSDPSRLAKIGAVMQAQYTDGP